MRHLATAGMLAALLVPAARAESAAPTCGTGDNLMSWPNVNPVWQFCWRRAQDSTGPNGSGLEIHDVYYKGKLVLKRAHCPILNVLYDAGGCGCYRDWSDQEVVFQSDNEIFPGYSEPTSPPLTVCDTGGSAGDQGTFFGVAAEKSPDLIMTTQYEAGWYRYTMKWIFKLDGTIQTYFGFAAVSASCVNYSHVHHVYWRLDFDIDGAANDMVSEGAKSKKPVRIMKEDKRMRADAPGMYWIVRDMMTNRGYKITPGPDDQYADPFGVADAWILAYHAGAEIDDTGQSGPPCAIKFTNFLNNESVYGADVVFWYGGHAEKHMGGDLDVCHVIGPTLTPVGNW
ncbi:MAG: hypothetical protein U0166_07405 [Acidobacteriota bacterium]